GRCAGLNRLVPETVYTAAAVTSSKSRMSIVNSRINKSQDNILAGKFQYRLVLYLRHPCCIQIYRVQKCVELAHSGIKKALLKKGGKGPLRKGIMDHPVILIKDLCTLFPILIEKTGKIRDDDICILFGKNHFSYRWHKNSHVLALHSFQSMNVP